MAGVLAFSASLSSESTFEAKVAWLQPSHSARYWPVWFWSSSMLCLPRMAEIRLLALDDALEQRRGGHWIQRAGVVHPDGLGGAHGQGVAELLLDLLAPDAHHHHLTAVLGGEAETLLHRDLVEGVDLVLEPLLHDARAVGLHLDLRLGVFHPLGGHQDLHATTPLR